MDQDRIDFDLSLGRSSLAPKREQGREQLELK